MRRVINLIKWNFRSNATKLSIHLYLGTYIVPSNRVDRLIVERNIEGVGI